MARHLTQEVTHRSRNLLLAACAVGLIAAGSIIFSNQSPKLPIKPAPAITYSVSAPSETKPDAAYVVPADQPLKISIADRDIVGYIQRVGVDQNKAIAAPNNVHLAGWFVDSVLPGRKGLSIIDGHVDGVSQAGIFHNLSRVINGDTIVITTGDGSTLQYEVVTTRTVETGDTNAFLFDQDPKISSQLNLITCTGRFDSAKQGYDKRIIVSAKLVP